jgi:4-hydroxy-tetrahydrodipicolinate reductase
MIRVAVCGAAGRMGQALRALVAAAEDLTLSGGIDRGLRSEAGGLDGLQVVAPDGAAQLLDESDVVIDFSAPAALRALLVHGTEALAGKALIVGTTGLTTEEDALLGRAAERSAVVVAANFSVGVNLLLSLTEQAARVLTEERFDVEIVEAHHRRKVDAPSGTALALARAVARGRAAELDALRRDGRSGHTGERPAGEIGLHAVRGGSVVGEHRVLFLGDAERVELVHSASSRELFAEGALLAARWAHGRKPGRYDMAAVLGF